MKMMVKTFENTILLETEVLSFLLEDNAVILAMIPLVNYPTLARMDYMDLHVVHLETTSLNYQGSGRLIEAYPVDDGAVLRIKFDTAYDIV
jgi:hypothetical protein